MFFVYMYLIKLLVYEIHVVSYFMLRIFIYYIRLLLKVNILRLRVLF
jgi:hypothetical protein